MRNKEEEAIPLVNIERNPLVIIISLVLSAAAVYGAYALLRVMNPWGFLMLAPAAMLSFQTLWLILNPFAIISEKKLEIRQSFFHHKNCYFIDIKRISRNKEGRLFITYLDDEIERMQLFGIKAAHVELMKNEVEKLLAKDLSATA